MDTHTARPVADGIARGDAAGRARMRCVGGKGARCGCRGDGEVASVIRLVHGSRADGPMRSLARELSRRALVDRGASAADP